MTDSSPTHTELPPIAPPGGGMEPVRVLLVSPLPPPPGGMETWTRVLLERGVPPPFEYELVDTRAYRSNQASPPRLNVREIRRNVNILRGIHKAVSSGRISMMHLNCSLTLTGAPRNLASVLIAKRAGVPYVLHLHGTFRVPSGNSLLERFYRWAYRKMFDGASSILALGEPSYDAIQELGDYSKKTMSLMRNFVDFREFPGKGGSGDENRLKVIYSGALIESKGIHTLVEVAARLPNLDVFLVGDGPEDSREMLVNHIREAEVGDRVYIVGPVGNGGVIDMLSENDVFILPSKFEFEGFPYSVAEAMAVGLPVVASRRGAIPVMVDVSEGGYLVDPDDIEEHVSVLSELRDDSSLRERMGRHNRGKALREYDYDAVIPQLCDLYSQAVKPDAPSNPRVLLVSAISPPPGGIETWTHILLQRGLPPPFEYELVDTRAYRGHQASPLRLNIREIKRNANILWKIHRAVSSGRISVMHLNCALTLTGAPRNFASAFLAKRAGVPCVLHLHGTFRVPSGNSLMERFYRWAYRKMFDGASSVLALGEPSYDSIQELGDYEEKTVSLMRNFVDFRELPDKRGPAKENRLKVVYSGALVESKGVHTLVEAAARLPDVVICMVGDGPEYSREMLVRHIHEVGVEDRIYIIGPIDNRGVVKILSEHDVFVLPSHTEGFPYSVAEAMAVGLPVVASPVGAIPEMVDVSEGGYLVDHDDIDGYVDALAELRDDPSLRERMGRHNRDKALREYEYEEVIRQLCEVYSRALHHLPPPPDPDPADETATHHQIDLDSGNPLQPSVSVIIPARNADSTLPATLDSVFAQDYSGAVDVIVADGSDSSSSAEMLQRRYPSVRIIPNPERTIPAALNYALQAAAGDVIVRCDAHAALPPGYIRRAVDTLARTGAATVGGRQCPVGTGAFERAVSMATTSLLGTGAARYRLGGPEGPADTVYLGVWTRQTLLDAGGFDQSLRANEDYELNWRLRRRGGVVWFDPNLAVAYRPRSSVQALSRQYFGYGRWKAAMLMARLASPRPRQLAAPLLVLALAASAVLAVAGFLLAAAVAPLVYLSTILGASAWIGVRRRDAAAFLLPIALAAIHLSWGTGFFFPPRITRHR